MKKILIYSSILLAGALSSCVSESPFGAEGEGALRMTMTVNGDLTRAESDIEANLAASCKILISKAEKGLVHKYDGISSIPDRLVLSTGSYVVEGYAGDSVSASWDKKFYKGRREFNIQSGADTEVSLVCGIANVVVAVDGQDMDSDMIKDWKLTVGHSRAELDFSQDNIDEKGYFMMPSADWNAADGTDLGSLHYNITGKDGNGKAFPAVTGTVDNVKPAHQYTFNVHFGLADVSSLGGGYISVEVDETDLRAIEDTILFFGPPAVISVTEGVNLDSSITFAPNSFPNDSLEIGIKSHKELASLHLAFSPNEKFGLAEADYDVLSYAGHMALANAKIVIKDPIINTINGEDYETRYISFPKEFLDKLEKGTYYITVTATDQGETDPEGNQVPGKTTVKVIELLVDNAKVLIKEKPMKVRSYSAQMTIQVNDKDVTSPGVRYRVKGSQEDWKVLLAQDNVVTFADLIPDTTYEVQAIADDYVNEVGVEFTTEGIFQIPNSSFEEWDTSGGVIFPGTDAANKYWDTGNQGAKIAGSVITDKSTDMVHSGTYSAKLTSLKAAVMGIGKLAAGNIFTGSYDKTSGTNGELTFGRPFDGTHPVALSGYANYRPGTVDEGKSAHIAKGETDQGQIYVALTTRAVQIKTADIANYCFNPEGDYVIAYGEVTWHEGFGDDGTLKKFEIKLNYVAGKEDEKPSHLVVVASSSKFGDYFEGSSSSVMYLDDLELVYE